MDEQLLNATNEILIDNAVGQEEQIIPDTPNATSAQTPTYARLPVIKDFAKSTKRKPVRKSVYSKKKCTINIDKEAFRQDLSHYHEVSVFCLDRQQHRHSPSLRPPNQPSYEWVAS